jgi:hypothetical protein
MKYITLLMVLSLLVACTAPVVDEKNVEPADIVEVDEPQPEIEPEPVAVTEPLLESEPVEEEPEEVPEATVDLYSDLGCENLFSVEEFADICGLDPVFASKTFRSGTKNCYIAVRHITDRTSTANVEAYEFESPEEATKEFDRRLKVRLVGASPKTIAGARTYEFDQLGRHNIEFVKGNNIVSVHSSTALCPEDKLVKLARLVGKRV